MSVPEQWFVLKQHQSYQHVACVAAGDRSGHDGVARCIRDVSANPDSTVEDEYEENDKELMKTQIQDENRLKGNRFH